MIKVKITKSSDYRFEELKEFSNEKEMIDYGITLTNGSREIIISKDEYNWSINNPKKDDDKPMPFKDCDYEMEIYDDYRE